MEIMDFLEKLIEFVENSGIFGVIISCGLMSIESIVPMIPLVALITINMMVMGKVVGFIISWFFTVLGCIMSYWIFRKGLGKRFDMFTENKEKIDRKSVV